MSYNLYTQALYYLLQAYNINLASENLWDYYLKIAFLALEDANEDVAQSLFNYLQKKAQPTLRDKPEFLYLASYFTLKKDFNSGLKILTTFLESPMNTYFKKKILQYTFQRAVEKKNLNVAFNLLNKPYFEPSREDYLILLTESFEKDPKLFEEILKEAKKRFPKDDKILFLEAYHLERKGEIKKSEEVLATLHQTTDWEGKLVKEYERQKKLLEKARNLVY